jgi:hypothetical protein
MDVDFHGIDGASFLRLQFFEGNRHEVTLILEFASAGLSGHSACNDYYWHDIARFLEELRAFSVAHQGEARLESFDLPGFSIHVWPQDLARHVGLEPRMAYVLGGGEYEVRMVFELDPSRWDALFADLQALLDAAANVT